MSFSGNVKDELADQWNPGRHCQIAEMAAILSMIGEIVISGEKGQFLKISTENIAVARKCFTLMKKTFNIKAETSVRRNPAKRSVLYSIIISRRSDIIRVLEAAKLLDKQAVSGGDLSVVPGVVVRQSCCKRSFIRGAFLAAGSMSNPERGYHFEIVCTTKEKAERLQGVINSFQMDAKIVQRKKAYVVYLKEGAQIVDVLNIMEAHVALMELENVRIVKEVRNRVNRKVNCETANINKTVSAAVKQRDDIIYLRDRIGFDRLSGGLREIALVRLEYPDATLKELGECLSPPVGKSGVNHRLRKLSEMAEKLRAEQGGRL